MNYESLPNNYNIAKSRLVRLQKQLNLNPELREVMIPLLKLIWMKILLMK